MNSSGTWNLKFADGTSREFIDLRQLVGNKIIRAYVLKPLLEQARVQWFKASLRGPKGEFKDFADFLVLKARDSQGELMFLVEAGVYQNMRIVGTDRRDLSTRLGSEVIDIFTNASSDPKAHDATLVLSIDSKVRAE